MNNKNFLITEAGNTAQSVTNAREVIKLKKEFSRDLFDIIKDNRLILSLYTICGSAVAKVCQTDKAIFKDTVILHKNDEDGSDDDSNSITQSVFTYNKVYFDILRNANAERKRLLFEDADDDATNPNLSSGSARVIKMVVKGGDVRFSSQDGTQITPDICQEIDNALNGKYDQLKNKANFHARSKSVLANISKDQKAILNSFASHVDAIDQVADARAIPNKYQINLETAKTLFNNAVSKIDMKRMSKEIAKLNPDNPDDAAYAIAKILSICIIGKSLNMRTNIQGKVAKDAKAAADKKAADQKALDEKFQAFVKEAKAFQDSLPVKDIAQVCDLPGTEDIQIDANLQLFDVQNNLTGITLGIDEEIDSQSEIDSFAEFLTKTTNDMPISPAAYQLLFKDMAAQLNEKSKKTIFENVGISAGAGIAALAGAAAIGKVAATGAKMANIAKLSYNASRAALVPRLIAARIASRNALAVALKAVITGPHILTVGLPIAAAGVAAAGFFAWQSQAKKQHVRKGIRMLQEYSQKAANLCKKYQEFMPIPGNDTQDTNMAKNRSRKD